MTIQAVTKAEPRAKSVLFDMAERYQMEPAAFEATLRATVVPSNTSKEQFAAFLMVARDYELNPITKEIFAFPTKSGGIQPIVSVDGWASIINRRTELDGIEFIDQLDQGGKLFAITCRMHRKDRKYPTEVIEYMSECARDTSTWKQWPARMLRHKALIQCARIAFAISGIVEPDEWERLDETHPRDVTTRPTRADFAPRDGTDVAMALQARIESSTETVAVKVGEKAPATVGEIVDNLPKAEATSAALDWNEVYRENKKYLDEAENAEDLDRRRDDVLDFADRQEAPQQIKDWLKRDHLAARKRYEPKKK